MDGAGRELWIHDAGGTRRVADIVAGSGSSSRTAAQSFSPSARRVAASPPGTSSANSSPPSRNSRSVGRVSTSVVGSWSWSSYRVMAAVISVSDMFS